LFKAIYQLIFRKSFFYGIIEEKRLRSNTKEIFCQPQLIARDKTGTKAE
jgi:hypothetical protein